MPNLSKKSENEKKTANDFFDYAEEKNITVIYCSLPVNKSISTMDTECNCAIGIYEHINNESELKVRIAHECGHCEKGAFYNRYSKLDIKSRHEVRADKWAIQHLVTAEELQEAFDSGLTEIWQLSEYFDIPQPYMQKIVNYHAGKEWY